MRHDHPTPPDRPYTVLVVCTGNICRSPAVERLLAAELGAATSATGEGLTGDGATGAGTTGLLIESAGVGAVVGAPMPAPMAALVQAEGVSPYGFAARQLTEQMLRSADLVLALTRWHRSKIVDLYPGVVRRTFTLREFARLASGVDPAALPMGTTPERLAALLPLAAAQRGVRRQVAGQDDVVDPYGGDDALYQRAFDELQPAVAEIARVVRG